MSEIELRFTPENEALVLKGRKWETIRRERHGRVGDYFFVGRRECVLTHVTPMTVRLAALTHHYPLGWDHPEQVLAELERCYTLAPGLDRIVYVHGWVERKPQPFP